MKLTKAQARVLRRLAAVEGASLSYHAEDRGYFQMPKFSGRFHQPPCPTCGHSTSEPVAWSVVEGLAAKGAVKERIRGAEVFYITPEGRAALQSEETGK